MLDMDPDSCYDNNISNYLSAQARAFNCRSLSQKDDRCYLSGDDTVTLPSVPQPTEPGRRETDTVRKIERERVRDRQ